MNQTLDNLLGTIKEIAGNPNTPDMEVIHAQMAGIALLLSEILSVLKRNEIASRGEPQ